jgi:hypothetical protein
MFSKMSIFVFLQYNPGPFNNSDIQQHGNVHCGAVFSVVRIRRWHLGRRRQDVVRATQLARVEARVSHGSRLQSCL